MHMPTEPEIRDRADALGLLDADGELSPDARKKAAALLIREQQEAAQQPPPRTEATKRLLSRQVIADADDRHLIVEVWEQKEGTAQ